MKRLTLLIILLVSFPALAMRTVKVGIASNFSELSTVSFNPFGGYFKDAVDLAIIDNQRALNKAGIKIELKDFDYGNSEVNVIKKVKTAAQSDVVAVIGYNYSSNALIAGPNHQKFKLPMLSPSASANRLGDMGEFIHLGSFNNQFMASTLAKFALKDLKKNKVLILTAVDCAYCVDLSNTFTSEIESNGGKVVKNISLLQEDKSYESLVSELRKYEFDLVFIPNQELTSARLISAMLEAGIKVPFLGADGWGNEGTEFFRVLKGKTFEGYSVTHWYPELKTAKSKQFVRNYLARYKKLPNDTSVLAYDSMSLLIKAIIQTKNLNRLSLNQTLNNIRAFDGITGRAVWMDQRAPYKDIVLLKTNERGFSVLKLIGLSSTMDTK